jgi:Fe-S-cluster containining protein
MNVPAVAQKTFDELKKEAKFLGLVQLVLKKLNKLHLPVKRAEYVHRMVDDLSGKIFQQPLVQQLSPCKQGCTACCHTQVSVTEDEAELLAEKIHAGVDINLQHLMNQVNAKNDSPTFFSLSYEERKCVFLDEEGSCKVYADRPSVCRTNAVIGDSSQCDTSEGTKPTRLVKTHEADLVIYASFLHSKINGSLPYMLAKALKKIDQ